MKLTRRTWFVVTAGMAVATSSTSIFARTNVIKVSLWDKGGMSMNMRGKSEMMGMGHRGGTMPMAPMGIQLSSQTVPAGKVVFDVTNTSKDMVHEMVVSSVKDKKVPLPYNEADMKVDEDAAGHLGEVAELEPGQKGGLTLTLKPGRYILYCNVPGHYSLGMWTLLTAK